MQHPIDKELLKKYLKDACTPSELEIIRGYLGRPGTSAILQELIAEESAADWERATNAPVELDEQLISWQSKFEQRKASLSDTPKITKGFFRRNNFLKYAAVLSTIILGIGIYTFNSFQKKDPIAAVQLSMKTFTTVKGQRAKVTLTDGTIVYMGAGSTLEYPEQFKDSIRGVSLKGEAFFDVAKNPRQPFIIQTENIRTQVLGTSFKVNAISGKPFQVQVATGKVRVDRINEGQREELAILTPGQQLSLKTLNDQAVSSEAAVADIQGWKNSRLVFKDQTIQEISEQLERAYDVRFTIKSPKKAAAVVTVTLQDNIPLNETLRVLSAGAHFKYQIQGKNIIIK
ncbi:FecR domain-containing protein [Pedobacter sp. N36a]|uniref:FecR family protein n=1 Tax=Pedobacter sp. N36a TaxID=2767996 RepID=UPI001656CEE5|nr:FecR domain-containing protein [Pedobacter sp. N36a]MBC8988109.1 FecR domain-containing protein [Pedobacter sp. N36a]